MAKRGGRSGPGCRGSAARSEGPRPRPEARPEAEAGPLPVRRPRREARLEAEAGPLPNNAISDPYGRSWLRPSSVPTGPPLIRAWDPPRRPELKASSPGSDHKDRSKRYLSGADLGRVARAG